MNANTYDASLLNRRRRSTSAEVETRRAALGQADRLVPRWLPHGRRVLDRWEYETIAVSLATGRWWCSNTNARGYDLISLRAWLDGTNQGKAAWRIMREIGPC
jgi:hypothetical protein